MIAQWDGMAILYGTQPVPAPGPLGSAREMAVMLADWGWETCPPTSALYCPAPSPCRMGRWPKPWVSNSSTNTRALPNSRPARSAMTG